MSRVTTKRGTPWRAHTNHLVCDSLNNWFPFGKIQQISDVGSVQKVDKSYVKDSVDGIIEYLPTYLTNPKMILCEMNARATPETTQQKCKRVLQCHNNEKYMSTHSDSPSSWNYINKPSERLQVLYHCYAYETIHLLNVARYHQETLPGLLIDINPNLLEKYSNLLSHLYSITLNPFYKSPNLLLVESEIE